MKVLAAMSGGVDSAVAAARLVAAGHDVTGVHLALNRNLFLLDAEDIHASAGSACRAGVYRPSEVLLAMGAPEDEAMSTVRFSLGHTSGRGDVDRLREVLPVAVERARAAG